MIHTAQVNAHGNVIVCKGEIVRNSYRNSYRIIYRGTYQECLRFKANS